MANKKYKLTDGNMWATDGIHDFGQNKTQRTINSEVNTALGGKAPTNHASTSTTYGKGTSSNYGHVKISDSLTDTTPAATGGVVPSMKAVSDLNGAISNAQKITSHELYIHSGTTAVELGRAIMLVYGKLFLLHGIVTVTTALSQGAVIYDLPSYNYGLANMNNNPIVAADNSSYTTVGVDNTNKTLKVTYNGGMPTGRFEMFLMGWIN